MGKKLIVGVNDLKSVNPALAAEWNYEKNGKLLPEMISANSSKKVWWKCKNGHEWQVTPNHRTRGDGCPYCSGHRVLKGFNDLQTLNPTLASEWHPTKNGSLKPTDVTLGNDKKVWWLGKCGHEWYMRINHRTIRGRGCPFCSNKQILIGYNDLITTNPELAAEWHPTQNGNLKPIDVSSGSNRKVWWLGKCGHEWESRVNHRRDGVGCPYCAGQKVLKGFNDLATTNPELAAEWHPTKNSDLAPTDVISGSNRKVWWLCSVCGKEWEASLNHRRYGRGCPICYESHLENFTEKCLVKYGYDYKTQVKFNGLKGVQNGLLSFDFGIYENGSLDILIECQGEQHYHPVKYFGGNKKYKKQLKHDNAKTKFCMDNHILLIEIPYWMDDEEIEAIFSR